MHAQLAETKLELNLRKVRWSYKCIESIYDYVLLLSYESLFAITQPIMFLLRRAAKFEDLNLFSLIFLQLVISVFVVGAIDDDEWHLWPWLSFDLHATLSALINESESKVIVWEMESCEVIDREIIFFTQQRL